MDNFLKSLANYLYKNHSDEFRDITLVFPNRRSGVFFMNELKQLVNDRPVWAPVVSTINEFMYDQSKLAKAESICLLSELYVIYGKLSGSNESFDSFYGWGELLLADFNDVDKYMVNAESVFINVKNYKSLENRFDFLNQEQIATLKRFFDAFDAEKSTKIKEEFLKIWEIMLPMYTQFGQNLSSKGLGYEGMVYQDALSNIRSKSLNNFRFKQIFFIGFNAITPVEEEVFKVLKNLGLARFFWDYDEYYIENNEMEAGIFQRKYLKEFPSVVALKNTNQLKGKTIKVVSAPTNHGQIFAAQQVLNSVSLDNPADTAIILSDEQLLMPVINNIPAKINDVNITMGFPVNESLTGNFIDLIMQLQLNLRINNSGLTFYHKQVFSLLRHPFIKQLCGPQTDAMLKVLIKENLYFVPEAELKSDTLLIKIFKECKSVLQFGEYLDDILQYIQEKLSVESLPDQTFVLEREFVFKFRIELKNLIKQLFDYKIEVQLPTFFSLLKRVLHSLRLPFEGEPVTGLQVMGFLETRNLDFKNVIIMSVNEGVIPGQGKVTSFIPYGLRRGFGLPTIELNDAMYAYYFYRLMQGAENIWLIYNSGVGDNSTGEKSRLIYQLEYNPDFTVKNEVISQTIDIVTGRKIEIEKNGPVWDRLNEYIDNEKDNYLSPSALSVYLQCPLRFYFKNIAKVKESDELEEVVDARLFGNIFHTSAEKLYSDFLKNSTLITPEILNEIVKNEPHIDKIIQDSFAEVFFGQNTQRVFTIDGKNQVIFEVIKKYLIALLKRDRHLAPLNIVALEEKVLERFKIKTVRGEYEVNIGGMVDRIDRSDNGLRVIDYKTGSDKLAYNELDEVFSHDHIKNTKAVFQTFIYSLILSKKYVSEKAIIPMVYQVKQLFEPGSLFHINSKKHEAFSTGNFLAIKDEVESRLISLLEEIFDPSVLFTQTTDQLICENCPYCNMCGR